MKLLPLLNGGFTQVDDRVYDFFSNWNWTKDISRRNYVYCTSTELTERRLHRVIMLAKKGEIVDHIDGNPLNNQVANLRICTHEENMRNRKPNKNNKSGYKGVFYLSRVKKWRASIKVNGKFHHIGLYETKEQAAIAYNTTAKQQFGNYAHLNTIGAQS